MVLVEHQVSNSGISPLPHCSFALLHDENYTVAKLYWNTLLYGIGCIGTHCVILAALELIIVSYWLYWKLLSHFCLLLFAIAVPFIKVTFLHDLNSTYFLTSAQAPEYLNSQRSFSWLSYLL